MCSSEGEQIPNILISDDIASNLIALEFQVSTLRGPDGERQICDKTVDDLDLVSSYLERLQVSIESEWRIKPYQIIITDAQMPFLSGPDAVLEIRNLCKKVIAGEELTFDIDIST